MPASLTTLTANTRNATQSTDTSSNFTPAANALLLLHAQSVAGSAPATPTISDSAGLTWTTLLNGTFNSTNRTILAYAVASNNPSLMSASLDWGGSTNQACMGISQSTGYDTSAPFASGSTLQGSGTGTTASISNAPAMASSGNVQALFVASRTNGSSAEAGWAEAYDMVAGTNCHLSMYTIGYSGDTSPTATLNGSVSWRAFHVEIAESIEAVVGVSTALRISRRRRR